jgi:hypothetical protein
MKNLLSKRNLCSRTTILALLLFAMFNFVFWLIVFDPELRKIFYKFLHNLVDDRNFVSTVGALITGAVSMIVGILFTYKEKKDKDV